MARKNALQVAATKGGQARANALDEKTRSAIAQLGAETRWGTVAPHEYVGKRHNTARCEKCGRGFRAACHRDAGGGGRG